MVDIAPSVIAEAPLIKAQDGPSKAAAPVAAALVKLALADVPAAAPTKVAGTHVVQLGAFSSPAAAERAWNLYSKRFGVLNGFGSANSKVTVNGKTLVRLAATGFGNAATANAACKQIKAMGGVCLVKNNGGQPVRLAASRGRRVAAR